MSVNIRSISIIVNSNTFKSQLTQLPILPNITAIRETWFQSNLTEMYTIPGYNAGHYCRSYSYGGTLIMY